jgi:hypothetical protein
LYLLIIHGGLNTSINPKVIFLATRVTTSISLMKRMAMIGDVRFDLMMTMRLISSSSAAAARERERL